MINGYKLISITDEDSDLIYFWRNKEHIRVVMKNNHFITKEEHENWFNSLISDVNKIYKILTYNDSPIGLANIKMVDFTNKIGEWGFYIGELDAKKGSGTVLGILMLDYLFEHTDICSVLGNVKDTNLKSINLHKKLGFIQTDLKDKNLVNQESDCLTFILSKEDWTKKRRELINSEKCSR